MRITYPDVVVSLRRLLKRLTHMMAHDKASDIAARFTKAYPLGYSTYEQCYELFASDALVISQLARIYGGVVLTAYTKLATALVADYGTAIVGSYATAIAGSYGNAIAGECGAARAGDYGRAIVGPEGIATAGDHGEAHAGFSGVAKVGRYGKAAAGVGGHASAGQCGAISIAYFPGAHGRPGDDIHQVRWLVGHVGDGLLPDVLYYVENGTFMQSPETPWDHEVSESKG